MMQGQVPDMVEERAAPPAADVRRGPRSAPGDSRPHSGADSRPHSGAAVRRRVALRVRREADLPHLGAPPPSIAVTGSDTRRFVDFLESYPQYAVTHRVDELRATEYTYLDDTGNIYLDYAGAGLPSESQIQQHGKRVGTHCFGNPHSENPTSSASTELVEQTRKKILEYFNASPEEYAVIFTQNATGACRLVGEAYPFHRSPLLVLTFDNHNSVHGIREFARARGAEIRYVPVWLPDLRADRDEVGRALHRPARRSVTRRMATVLSQSPRLQGSPPPQRRPVRTRRGLFAFPAQSNFTGVQHSLDLISLAHEHDYDVLLDAAAYLPTNRLDLSLVHPDFMPVSWYKVFGYPTGVGCLLARREAMLRLHRPWFSGGTIQAVSVKGDWSLLADDETAFEDGTLNFLNIPDIEFGLSWVNQVGIEVIHQRVRCLTGWLIDHLSMLRHSNGRPMVLVYGPTDLDGRGGTVAFNFLDERGAIVDERLVSREATAAGISLRTGCFCNPGAAEVAFDISKEKMSGAGRRGADDIDGYLEMLGMTYGGAVRVSLGIASSFADVERLLRFAERTYRDRVPATTGLEPRLRC